MPIRSEPVNFPGSGGQSLAARLDRPHSSPRACALFAHCFTCGKDSIAASRISRALAERGIAVLRFDFTGLGGSDGDFANSDFSSNVEDLLSAASFLGRELHPPELLVGHSLGGTAVLAAAARLADVKAVATVNAPYETAHIARLLADASGGVGPDGTANVVIGGRTFRITKQFFDDLTVRDPDRDLRRLGAALLIFHAPEDRIVSVENARRIYDAARHPKSFVALDGADHLLRAKRDAEYVAAILSAWAARYLEAGSSPDARALPTGEVEVCETLTGKYAQRVTVGPHHLVVDEPVKNGGDDTGPSPYGLLLAGLGACTSMTLRMYAEHKGLPLERVSVRLRHQKVRAEDCADCRTETGKVDVIERELRLEGPLAPAQRERLLEIANRCPVHRTLHAEVVVRGRLSGADGD
jgi:uncharacterized OsmC-like protein/pimeloyl-ACP methyl ester carboxylesterase